MRISDVSTAYTSLRSLQSLKTDETEIQNSLVSGKKVDDLTDDPALAQTLLNSQTDIEQLVQYRDNTALADNIAQAGIDNLSYIDDEIDLAISVGETGQTDSTVASEIDNIIGEVLSTANITYGDDSLFAGSASGVSNPYSLDTDTTSSTYGQYIYSGSGDGREIQVSDGVSVSPFTDSAGTQAILDTLNALVALRDAITAGDTDAISAASDTLSTAQDEITDASSDLGTTQARLELIDTRNSTTYTNLDDAEEYATNSSEEEETVKLLAAQNAYSAALQGTSLLMQQTILDYL